VAIVAAVGEGMRGTPGVAARVFGALGRAGVNVMAIAQGSSELNISFVVADGERDKAVLAVHEEFHRS
jgi:aspartokinase